MQSMEGPGRSSRKSYTGSSTGSSKASGRWQDKKVQSVGSKLDALNSKVVAFVSGKESDAHMLQVSDELAKAVQSLEGRTVVPGRLALLQKVNTILEAALGGLESVSDKRASEAKRTLEKLKAENTRSISKMHFNAGVFSAAEISTNEAVTRHLHQVMVFDQHEDATGSGFENCGYHALKNALIALIPDTGPSELEGMFHDKDLFLDFYRRYCAPVIGGTKGGKDASVPRLREVISRFLQDQSPPKSLVSMQKVLRQSIDSGRIAIFQISTTTGGDKGDLRLGFFDQQSSFEGKKLFDLAKHPGPLTLSAVFGNEIMGHWYTVVVHKDEGGEYRLLGMDSLDNHHSDLGLHSALSKMERLILSKLKNPHQLLKEALEPVQDFISPRANWFAADGSVSESYRENLLDDEPVPELASAEAPSGSIMERNLASCVRSFDLLQSADLLDSSDYWIQKQLAGLETLASFYARELPQDHSSQREVERITSQLKASRRENIVEETFSHALAELEAQEASFTSHQYSKAVATFKQMRTLFRERSSFTGASSEIERMGLMNQASGYSGVEQGFVTGAKADDVERSLMEKVDLLLITYQEMVERNRLEDLVETIASGDGCLTARIGRVNQLFTELKGLGNIQDIISAEKVKQTPVLALSEAMQLLAQAFVSSKADQVLEMIDEERIRTAPDTVAQALKEYGRGDLGRPFREFLIKQEILEPESEGGGVPEADAIHWEKLLPHILNQQDTVKKFIQGDPKDPYDEGDKEQRFAVEAKGFVSRMNREDLLNEDRFQVVKESFQTYATGKASQPFWSYLMDQGVVPSTPVEDWETPLRRIFEVDAFPTWLSEAKEGALGWL